MRSAADLRRNIAFGSVSGLAWFVLAIAFDKGVRDFNYPVMPTNNGLAIAGCVLAAMTTGSLIMLVFGRLLTGSSSILFFSAPLVTLPVAISTFSVLVWCVWALLGEGGHSSGLAQFQTILSFYLLYGIMSAFTPFLYGACLVNQWAARRLMSGAT